MASTDFRTEKLNFKRYYSLNQKNLENAKNTFLSVISSILAEEKLEVYSIVGRVKNREECIKKFTRKYKDELEEAQTPYEIKEYINDLIGLRIVLLYESDIDKVGELLPKEFTVLDKTDKSGLLAKQDNIFGYKGLHLDMKLSDARASMREYRPYADFSFEVQIRTIIQDAWSVLDHKIKYKKAIPLYLERRINSLAALFEIADREFLDIHLANKAEEAKARVSRHRRENINIFTFNQLLEETIPNIQPQENRIGEFVDHILSYGDLYYDELKQMILEHLETVKRYQDFIQRKLGKNYPLDALSIIPHVLYLGDPKKYQGILPGFSETGFKEWCEADQRALLPTGSDKA